MTRIITLLLLLCPLALNAQPPSSIEIAALLSFNDVSPKEKANKEHLTRRASFFRTHLSLIRNSSGTLQLVDPHPPIGITDSLSYTTALRLSESDENGVSVECITQDVDKIKDVQAIQIPFDENIRNKKVPLSLIDATGKPVTLTISSRVNE
jgi:hypothetical protein